MYSQQDIQEELKKFSFGKDVVQKLISMPVDNYERFEVYFALHVGILLILFFFLTKRTMI